MIQKQFILQKSLHRLLNQRFQFQPQRYFTFKKKFTPFSIDIDKHQNNSNLQEENKPGIIKSLLGFFDDSKSNTSKEEQTINNNQQKNIKNEEKSDYEKKLDEQNAKLDKVAEPEIRKQILNLIETNINSKYFKEKKLDTFFEKCWQLKEPKKFQEESTRFQKFLYDDLKIIIQRIDNPYNIVDFTKFVVFFGVNDDPEIFDLLCDSIVKNIRSVKVDDILTILVNYAYTLAPNTKDIFNAANQEFEQRIRDEYESLSPELFIKSEDFIKVLQILIQHKQLSAGLRDCIQVHIEANYSTYPYEVLSELAILYASQMDENYKRMFFDKLTEKFIKDLQFLKEESLYKILWSIIKAKRLVVGNDAYQWVQVKEIIQKRAKELSPKILTDIMVLSTQANDIELSIKEKQGLDFWDSMESFMILKMEQMNLEDLINLMWASIKINKGSQIFFDQLEKMLQKQILKVKDEQFQVLISCFDKDSLANEESKFSDKFIQIVLKVIKDKKDRFQLRTLVQIVWSLARISFMNPSVNEVLKDLQQYKRIQDGLESMYQKSQCMLFWTYSRDDDLFDKEFLLKVIDSIIGFQGQVFELDNFDILLILQSALHLERKDEVVSDIFFMSKLAQLIQICDNFAQQAFKNFNMHEFTTCAIYFLNHQENCSSSLRLLLLQKINDSVSEFNEYQLTVFKKIVQQLKPISEIYIKSENLEIQDQLCQEILVKLDEEIDKVQQAKIFLEGEEKIRQEIRRRIQLKIEEKNRENELYKAFKKSGNKQADERLDKSFQTQKDEQSQKTINKKEI